jgi:nicotinate-nucleotide adenylyltransferase
MGEDNLRTFHKWKNYEVILERHQIYVYPRPITLAELNNEVAPTKSEIHDHKNVIVTDSPMMQISSTIIRNKIQKGQSIQYLVTDAVRQYIDEMNFYR